MGKNKKYKQLRKLATQLPQLTTSAIIGERVSGADLYAEGVTEVKGEPIDGQANYRRKKVVQVPFNNYKQMKSGYNSHGMAGAVAIGNAVIKKSEELQAEKDKK